MSEPRAHTDETIKALAIEANREEFSNISRDLRAMEGRMNSSMSIMFTGWRQRVEILEAESKRAMQSLPVIELWMKNHDEMGKIKKDKFRFGAQQIYNLLILFVAVLSLTVAFKVYEHSISLMPTAQAQTQSQPGQGVK